RRDVFDPFVGQSAAAEECLRDLSPGQDEGVGAEGARAAMHERFKTLGLREVQVAERRVAAKRLTQDGAAEVGYLFALNPTMVPSGDAFPSAPEELQGFFAVLRTSFRPATHAAAPRPSNSEATIAAASSKAAWFVAASRPRLNSTVTLGPDGVRTRRDVTL